MTLCENLQVIALLDSLTKVRDLSKGVRMSAGKDAKLAATQIQKVTADTTRQSLSAISTETSGTAMLRQLQSITGNYADILS